MFSLKDFINKTVTGMISNEPDYKVREYAAGWYSKAVLTQEDLADIDAAIEQSHIVPPVEEPIEPPVELPEEPTPEPIDPPVEVI